MERADKLADAGGLSKRKGLVQTLKYADEWSNGEYRLLELPKDLHEVIQMGDRVSIRGDSDDDAVLCTKTTTYSLKASDTSNALLLLPDISTSKSGDFGSETRLTEREVVACFDSYFELKVIRPKLERLKSVLDATAFNNRDSEDEMPSTTTSDLLDIIQASEEELHLSLQDLGALQIAGNWRILELGYQEKCFAQILALVEEQCWSCDEVPLTECCDVLAELYPRFALEHCLRVYGEEVLDAVGVAVTPTRFRLPEENVCRFYAQYILRPAGKFNYHEFMEAWSQSVPEGMTCRPEHLKGVALSDENSHPPVIWHFTDRDLPEDLAERFNILFKERAKWKASEIEPYLSGVLLPDQALNSLFLKFARGMADHKGEKLYSTKRPLR